MTCSSRSWGKGVPVYGLFAGVLIATVVTGCGCDDMTAFGVVVEVVDSVSGKLICDARLTLTDGAFVEEVSNDVSATCTLEGADHREGTYSVQVTHPDYAVAPVIVVKVEDEGCTVTTDLIRIELDPL